MIDNIIKIFNIPKKETNLFLDSQLPYTVEYSKFVEKAYLSNKNRVSYDNDITTIINGLIDVIKGKIKLFLKGGEFPASVFGNLNVVEQIRKLPKGVIKNEEFALFGGAYICIGTRGKKDEKIKFKTSGFMEAIIELDISYRVRKEIVPEEALYNHNLNLVHHPLNEHHFRLYIDKLDDSDTFTISHNHTLSGMRIWEKSKDKERVSLYKEMVKKIIEEKDEKYLPLKEILNNHIENKTFDDDNYFTSIKNQFIVDMGTNKKTIYKQAKKEEIMEFLFSTGMLDK